MGKGSSTTQTNSSSTGTTRPDENAYQAYLALLNRAGGVASTPYQGYGGEEVAPINAQQQAGFGNINTQQGIISATGAPISAADIQRYQDPYTNQVIQATQADFDAQNARAQSQTTGNAAAQGALGGDRSAVAAALTAEGQSRSQAPIIAGLRSQGYQQAVNTAENQQQQALRAGVAGLQGAQAQVGAGTLEQQTQQAKDTQGRMDYYQQQGYPFQVAQWLASIDTGVGSQMGGTSSSTGTATTQGPTPNPWAQFAGAGLTAASMFLERGGRVSGVHRFANGGGVDDDDGYAGGGSPWGNEQTWVPTVGGISAGKGAPGAPSLPSAPSAPQQKGLSSDQMKGVGSLGKAGLGFFNNPSYGGENALTGEWGGSSSNPLAGLSAEDYGAGFDRGGRVRRYANGGYAFGGSPDDDATFDDRFGAAYPNRMVSGVGASRPAFGVVSRGDSDVVNPDEPFRMLAKPSLEAEPPALEGWRGNVDRDRSLGLTAPEGDERPVPEEKRPGLPSIITAGRATSAPEEADEGPSTAMGYAGRPQLRSGVGVPASTPEGAPDEGFLSRLGIRMTPELKAGLLQAGLSMMATRHGGPGSFLQSAGEAGMTGVGAYSQTQQLAREAEEKLRKDAFEREKFEAPFSRSTLAQQETARHNKAVEAKDFKPTYGVIRKETDPETGFTKEVMGWIDPNTKTTVEASNQKAAAAAGAGSPVPASELQGVDYSRNVPRVEKGSEVPEPRGIAGKSAASIKADAEYYAQTGKLPPVRAGQSPVAILQQSYRNAVQNYGNALAESRGINPSQLAEAWRTAPGTLRFVLGADGRATVSLGTAVRHLDTLQTLADAWGATDVRVINAAKAKLASQFGNAAATNLEAAGRIVGPEIVKAIGVAGAGTAEERAAVEKAFSTTATPDQMRGAIKTTQALLGGQLEGRKRQAAAAGVSEQKFKDLIGERPYEILTSAEKGHGAKETGKGAATATITSKAEYDKLPSGSKFMKDGKEWTKP